MSYNEYVVPETDVVTFGGAGHHGTCGEECGPAPEEAVPEREHLLRMRARLLILQLLQDGALHGRVERVEEGLEAEELGGGGGGGEGGRGGHH